MESDQRKRLFERDRSDIRYPGGNIPHKSDRTPVLFRKGIHLVLILCRFQQRNKTDMLHPLPRSNPIDHHVPLTVNRYRNIFFPAVLYRCIPQCDGITAFDDDVVRLHLQKIARHPEHHAGIEFIFVTDDKRNTAENAVRISADADKTNTA